MGKCTLSADRPLISALLKNHTPDEYIAGSLRAAGQGADMIAMDIGTLKPEYRNEADFRKIFSAVGLPFYLFFYRGDQWLPELNYDDDARQKYLLAAADAGAEIIDVMGDLYDASAHEITADPQAIEKQKILIDRIRQKGAKVIISSHTPDFMSSTEIMKHMDLLAARGADIVKLVTGINSPEEFTEALRTISLLKEKLPLPFCYLCNGSFGRKFRFFAPALGSALSFASTDIPALPDVAQPNIAELQSVTRIITRNTSR